MSIQIRHTVHSIAVYGTHPNKLVLVFKKLVQQTEVCHQSWKYDIMT